MQREESSRVQGPDCRVWSHASVPGAPEDTGDQARWGSLEFLDSLAVTASQQTLLSWGGGGGVRAAHAGEPKGCPFHISHPPRPPAEMPASPRETSVFLPSGFPTSSPR